ncbi:MAG: sel1 repeat family protein [Ectothiorhodospiraceae bacterium]|nr:sel1 repeat family protein [Ectothiorhodospiraceae bacterium]
MKFAFRCTQAAVDQTVDYNGTRASKLNGWKKVVVGLSFAVAAMSAQADYYEDGLMAYAIGNYAAAGHAFMQAADAGNEGAEHMLMRMFSEKKMYANDVAKETLKWTRKAAEKGVMQAQFALANIYSEQANAEAAVSWYRKAAQQGHAEAHYKLGAIYEHGANGVSSDADESVRMYQIAASDMDVFAQKGDSDAQNLLAGMYQQGQGVNKDMTLALRWWEKSALQGNMLAQMSLGRLYARGNDVDRDTRLASYWLDLAAAQGSQEAATLLAEMDSETETTIAFAM